MSRGWGIFSQQLTSSGNRYMLELKHGTLTLNELKLSSVDFKNVTASMGDNQLKIKTQIKNNSVKIDVINPLDIKSGDIVIIEIN